jgi:hypothetical protein
MQSLKFCILAYIGMLDLCFKLHATEKYKEKEEEPRFITQKYSKLQIQYRKIPLNIPSNIQEEFRPYGLTITFPLLPSFSIMGIEISKQPKTVTKLKNKNSHKVPLQYRQKQSDETLKQKISRKRLNKFIKSYNKKEGEYPYHREAQELDTIQHCMVNSPEPARELKVQIEELKMYILRAEKLVDLIETEIIIKTIIQSEYLNQLLIKEATDPTSPALKKFVSWRKDDILLNRDIIEKKANEELSKRKNFSHQDNRVNSRTRGKKFDLAPFKHNLLKARARILCTPTAFASQCVNANFFNNIQNISLDHLVYRYNFSEVLYNLEDLESELNDLIVKYQGFTKIEVSNSLLTRYLNNIKNNQNLDKTFEDNNLEKYFYKPTENEIKDSDLREERGSLNENAKAEGEKWETIEIEEAEVFIKKIINENNQNLPQKTNNPSWNN